MTKKINSLDDIQALGSEISNDEIRLAEINEEFTKLIEASKWFEEYQNLKQKIVDARTEFDKAAIKFLKKTNQKTSEGPAGRITLAVRHSHKITNPDLLPEKYAELPELQKKAKLLDTELKREHEYFHNDIPGVEYKETEYIVWTKPKNELKEEN